MMTTFARLCLVMGLASVACSPVPAMEEADVGTYAADLPSASGCGRRLLLELFTDDSYVFVQTLVACADENRILENRG